MTEALVPGPAAPRFDPAGAVTGIGSLPIPDCSEAIEFVATHCPELPFCPQPPAPHLAEDTLAQQLDLQPEDPDGWLPRFVDAAVGGAFPRALALKTQVTGPFTLVGLLGARDHAPASPEALAVVADRVARLVGWQVEQLRAAGLPVVAFVDEPALVLIDRSEMAQAYTLLDRIFDCIRGAGGRSGLHCCATTSPGSLSPFGTEVVSFDASADLLPSPADAAALGDGRRTIAFGLVGAEPPPEPPGLAFSRWLTAAAWTTDAPSLARRTIVTTRCGLGRSTLAEAEAAFRAAVDVSRLVRQVAEGSGTPSVVSRWTE